MSTINPWIIKSRINCKWVANELDTRLNLMKIWSARSEQYFTHSSVFYTFLVKTINERTATDQPQLVTRDQPFDRNRFHVMTWAVYIILASAEVKELYLVLLHVPDIELRVITYVSLRNNFTTLKTWLVWRTVQLPELLQWHWKKYTKSMKMQNKAQRSRM